MRILFTIIILGFLNIALAQKKPIDTDAYYKWKYISEENISSKGNIIAHRQVSYRGNDTVQLHFKNDLQNPKILGRATGVQIDFEERFVAYSIKVDYDSIRKYKLDKLNKKKWTKDEAGIYSIEKDTTYIFDKVAKITVAKEGGNWVAMERDEAFELKKPAPPKENKCKLFKKKEVIAPKIKQNGNVFTLFNYTTKTSENWEGISDYTLNHYGSHLAYVHSFTTNDSIDSAFLFIIAPDLKKQVFALQGEIIQPTFNRSGSLLAFKSSVDTGEFKKHQLYLFNVELGALSLVADTIHPLFKDYQSVDAKSDITFSKDDVSLFFNVGIKPIAPAKDTLTDDEKYKLDIWSWTDGKLQPQQLLSAKKDERGLIDFVYLLEDKSLVKLSDTSEMSISYPPNYVGEFALVRDQNPYMKEMTWDYWYFDIYRLNLKTGESKKLYTKLFDANAYLSSTGEYLCYFAYEDSSWYSLNVSTNQSINITKSISEKFYANHHDVPQKMGPEGRLHWMEGEKSVVLEGQHDIWIVSLDGKEKTLLSNGKIKDRKYTYLKLDTEQDYISLQQPIYLKYTDNKTKAEGFCKFQNGVLTELTEIDAKIFGIKKAKNAEEIIFQYMTAVKSPELYVANGDFGNITKLTDLNPIQKEYNWTTVEMVAWKDYKGDSVKGLLYKPEDFDANKKYPMIVYYYERYTDDIHNYYRPKPTASIIFASEYASNGYIVFIPDITYEIGKPAQGAYNAIMSGTDYLLKNFKFIDSTKMGLQGQSWGGYQTAQLITMTDRYKCGMAGAPVSNMFSAYGGMRWGSGLSRTFQYETGQSRIGATIWEKPELYIENSPLFHLPKVNTPLLIMHNDGDGAVPWYQGIELFNGLRRLDKPVWMLNYNGDEHNLMKDANRMDLSIRMKQFFDYYLQDQPIPSWMQNGIPAVMKGKTNAY